ncbi:hypothetical protein OG568_43180 [Streptomyces sp. NBC_01450]|nr:hypothetical protein [Streptomyces sp. NBC_01450]
MPKNAAHPAQLLLARLLIESEAAARQEVKASRDTPGETRSLSGAA